MPHDGIAPIPVVAKFPIADGVIFIAKGSWHAGNNHPSRHIRVESHLHQLVQTVPPRAEVVSRHVITPGVLHLPNIVEPVQILRMWLVCVPDCVHHVLEPVPGHVRIQTKGYTFSRQDGLGGPPQIAMANSWVTCNEKQTPKESKEFPHVHRIGNVFVCLREDNIPDVLDREGEEEELKLIHLSNLIPPEIDPPSLHLLVTLPYPWARYGPHPLPDRWWAWIGRVLFDGLVVVVVSVPLRP